MEIHPFIDSSKSLWSRCKLSGLLQIPQITSVGVRILISRFKSQKICSFCAANNFGGHTKCTLYSISLTTYSLLWSNSLTWLVTFLFVTFFFFFWKYKKYLQKWANPAGRVLIGSVLIDKTWIWTKNSYNWNPNFRDPETCFIYIRYIIMQIYPKNISYSSPKLCSKSFQCYFSLSQKNSQQ